MPPQKFLGWLRHCNQGL